MIFDFLTPSPGAGQKNAVARPSHVSNSHTKFGWISSNGLGEDSKTDRQTDRRTEGQTDGDGYNSPLAFFKVNMGIIT